MADVSGVDRGTLDLPLLSLVLRELAGRVEDDWPEITPATMACAEGSHAVLLRTYGAVVFRSPYFVEINGTTRKQMGKRSPATCDVVLAERLEKAAYLCA
jgi:hypothetical protein